MMNDTAIRLECVRLASEYLTKNFENDLSGEKKPNGRDLISLSAGMYNWVNKNETVEDKK